MREKKSKSPETGLRSTARLRSGAQPAFELTTAAPSGDFTQNSGIGNFGFVLTMDSCDSGRRRRHALPTATCIWQSSNQSSQLTSARGSMGLRLPWLKKGLPCPLRYGLRGLRS